MSQEPPSAGFASGHSAASSAVRSGEQQFACSTSDSLRLNICHAPPRNKEGTLEYQAYTSLVFQAEDHYRGSVEFKHTLLLNADVPQVQGEALFDMDVIEYCDVGRCEKTTSAKRRPGAPITFHYQSDSHRRVEEQRWKLVDDGLNLLVRHYCEKWRDWNWKPVTNSGQETSAGMSHSGAASQKSLQNASEKTGTKINKTTAMQSSLIYSQLYCSPELNFFDVLY